MDQLQAFSLSNLHSNHNHLHHYQQHMSAAASRALLLPQMRDMITAYLARGRDDSSQNSSCSGSVFELSDIQDTAAWGATFLWMMMMMMMMMIFSIVIIVSAAVDSDVILGGELKKHNMQPEVLSYQRSRNDSEVDKAVWGEFTADTEVESN
jgi:hypothetical protein